MPNPLAYLMLAAWPFITVVLFRRYEPSRALIISLLGGYLFLPEPPAAFDLPLFPPFTKHSLPAMTAFFILLFSKDQEFRILPENRIAKGLVLVFVFSPIFTVLNNGESITWGLTYIPALGIKDAIALPMQQFLLLLPFFLARQLLSTRDTQQELLTAIVIGGLVYSVLMLIEVRLSPQLNNWIYGYYQHFFGQSIRFGGFRPVVFLYHGLWVAFFAMTAAVSAFALWRMSEGTSRSKYLFIGLYLSAVVVLAKSFGALLFLMALVPCVVLLSRMMQIKLAIALAALALAYPNLKAVDLVPQDAILAQFDKIDEDRGNSLRFRFMNEDALLERAMDKPAFGWGSWGRNQIYDQVTGELVTVSDGRWIIVFGVYGWIGFLAEFGLLTLPIFLLWQQARRLSETQITPLIAPMSLILAFNVFDMLPNATLTPLTWLMAGALTGYAERLRHRKTEQRKRTYEMKWRPIL